ncbi:MAG TPA: CHAT domain-containing tetratricopeptide repeat protein [Blastocatellia bacterium]|nr:CHAT domain-containing tetratricopeptide repeat protein [Blastocatellia bacterium]
MTSYSRAFVVSDQGVEPQSPETASRAEELFQAALELSGKPGGKSAHEQMNEAVRIWLHLNDQERVGQALVEIAEVCRQVKKYSDALSYYRQALDSKALPPTLRASVLNGNGLIYADLPVRDLAVHYFKLALEEGASINDLSVQTIALIGLGDVSLRNGELEQSQKYITDGLRLRETNHVNADPALLYLKGRVSQERGLVDGAQRSFDEAAAIYRKINDARGQARVLCALSTLSLFRSHPEVALEQAEEARALMEREEKVAVSDGDYLSIFELKSQAWLRRARAERALGSKDRALHCYNQGTGFFEGGWIGLYQSTETSAILAREEAQKAYRENIDLLVEQGRYMEAAGLADGQRSRALLSSVVARLAGPRSDDSVRAAARHELSRSIFQSRSRLLAPGVSRSQRGRLQKEIEEAEFKIEETRLQYEMEHVKDRLGSSKLPVRFEKLQAKMAQYQVSLVEFHLSENHSFAWLFARGEFYFEVLPCRKEIENAVKPYLDLLATPPNHLYIGGDLTKLREASKALFEKLFGGLSSHIESGDRLIIVPDGLLHYLPFETLVHNDRYLIEDHEVGYTPSASVLVQLQDATSRSDGGDRMELLAFGDPIFGAEIKPALTRKASGARKVAVTRNAPVKRRVATRRAVRRRPVDVLRDARISRGFQLPPLPRTRDEIQYIGRLFQTDRTRLYLGKNSTEAVLKREALRRYRRLHFATHSLVDESSPSRSAVVLTLDNNPEEDGFLEVNEIADLDLDCDLVVLSACQTGRGQVLSGEGIIGLSRAFLYAGARSVVVSLWSVTDISTGHLMKNFYQHLAGNLRNAAALRLAKLEMLRGTTETRHPYYWAPFITIGKP